MTRATLAGFSVLIAVALSLSCAAPAELARRSEAALAAGDARLAYDWAERAMRANPRLPRARAAMTAAAERATADWQSRVRNLARVDTVAAARLALEFAELRARLGGWDIPAPLDSAYLGDDLAIRNGAAGMLYSRGMAQMKERRPREAYRSFVAAGDIVPGFRDSGERARRSFELGVVRIAVLPFDDDTGVPGLADELCDYIRGQQIANMTEKKYPFVRFVSGADIASRQRSGARMTREEALRIGRAAGAGRVVWGRLHGLRSDTRTDTWHDRVFRKVAFRDSSGRSRVRFDETGFETVSREREVRVAWQFEVIDTDDESVLATREGSESIVARTVYTPFDPVGDSGDYCLAPPDWKSSNSEAWKAAERGWKERFGDWSVPGLLAAAHGSRDHPRYRPQDRERYYRAARPQVLDDLPPAGDLAILALREVATPVWEVLKGLEREPTR